VINTRKEEAYPWPLLARTILILLSYFAYGIVEVVRGPTLLDLKDLLGVSVGEISFVFIFTSIGSVAGCFSVGIIMDKIMWLRYPVLASMQVMMGVCACMFPYCTSLPALFTAAFFGGLGGGALDTGSQVLLLDVWRGRDSGPYMHALHFMFGIGAFLAPVIARPFLVNTEELSAHSTGINITSPDITTTNSSGLTKELAEDYDLNFNLLEDAKLFPLQNRDYRHQNSSLKYVAQILGPGEDSDARGSLLDVHSQLTIKTLYPIIGVFPILISLGYLMYFVYDQRKASVASSSQSQPDQNNPESKPASEPPQTKQVNQIKKMFLLANMMVFYFLYAGLEVAYGTFITTFAVTSKLGLTKLQGSDITAVFWAAFATVRALSIPAAVFLKPEIIMVFSFATCLVGSVMLSILGDTSIVVLYVASGLMGVGTASVYATGLLWLERRVQISNRISAAITISASLGIKAFPVLVGQTVENLPMSFMYITLGTSTGCSLLFGVNALLGRQLSRGQDGESSDQDQGRELDQDRDRQRDRELDQDKGSELDQDRGRELDQDKGRELDQDRGRELDQDRGRELDQDQGRELDQDQSRELDEVDPKCQEMNGKYRHRKSEQTHEYT